MRSGIASRAMGAALVVAALGVGCSSDDSVGPARSDAKPRHSATSLLVPRGLASHFEPTALGRVRPVIDPAALRLSRQPAHVELPERLGAPARIALPERGMSVDVTLLGTSSAAGEMDAGSWRHRGGAPGGGDVLWRPTAEGVEDYVTFASAPEREELEYRVSLEGISGLRLVGDSLELLDEAGTPRLRMGRPWVADRDGSAHPARVRLSGCNADTDPRPPWGRAVVAPGSAQCRVTVGWANAKVTYPAVVDPAWTTTGNMAEEREFHSAVRLTDGRVLVAGGWQSGLTAGVELFDPTTKTFSSTAPMSVPRAQQGFVLLGDGRVLAAGGWSQSSAEIWNPSTGTWSPTGSMAVQRIQQFAAHRLASGKVLVAGGATSPVTELYDPSSGTFTPTGDLKVTRYYDSASTLLADGRVFIVGGGSSGSYALSGEIYDPATGAWTLTANMKFGRSEHQAILLTDGRVLVPGGVEDDAIKYSDIYDPATNKWTPTPNLGLARRFYAATRLDDGRVIVVGGEILTPPWYTETAEIYDPSANTWTWASSMANGRYAPSLTMLADGSALVAGGYSDSAGYLNDAQVFRLLPDGAACSIDPDCTSGHCVDGVCCATTCGGLCQACSAALKTSGADGVCGPAKVGTSEAACAAQSGSPCGYVGTCDGQGACAFAAQGIVCASKQCSAGSLASFACNGQGACTQSSAPCAPYVCGTQTACATSCASDAECSTNAWCDSGGVCKPDLDPGSACSSESQCKSGFCVDGVCCDKACDAPCLACSAAKKGGGASGVCGPVSAGNDPDSDCPDDGASSCQRDGSCDGAGACRKYAAGVECAPADCAGNKPATYGCDGGGSCAAKLGQDCGAWLCSGSACTTSCSSDAQCAPSARCNSGSCVPLTPNGQKCAAGGECVSGFCVDGYCCNEACGGQCEACDVPGGEGFCVPAAGAPHGNRPACSAGDPQNPCSAAACDGIARDVCKDFVGSSVSCRKGSCTAGVATLAQACDGSGACPVAVTRPCAPYACNGDVCAQACQADSDCSSPAVCDTGTGKCVVPAKCLDEDTVETPNGQQVECAPYRCADGACGTSCSSIQDCAASYVCGPSGMCQKPTPTSDSGDSSGCALAPRGRPGPSPALSLVVLAALALRRRRATAAPRRRDPRP